MKLLPILSVATLLPLAACMTPPTAAEMAKVPVVKFGQPAPADRNFVLLYPAGAALPVDASVGGSLITQPAAARLNVTLKHDVYLYRYWISFDGKTWFKGSDKSDSRFEIHLPGESDGVSPGKMTATFDEK
jgi:hypothetical protein